MFSSFYYFLPIQHFVGFWLHMPFFAWEFKFNKTWHATLLNPSPKSFKGTKNVVVNFRFQKIYNDSSPNIEILILWKILFFNLNFQPKVLEFFLFCLIPKCSRFRSFENSGFWEIFSKIFKNYFKFILVRNDLEWLYWIFEPFYFGLNKWQPTVVITYFTV